MSERFKRLLLSGTLTTLSGLHIGASRAPAASGADKTVIRDYLGHPYVPGSSLKGVVRAATSGILREFENQDAQPWWPCRHWACPDDLSQDVAATLAGIGSCFHHGLADAASPQEPEHERTKRTLIQKHLFGKAVARGSTLTPGAVDLAADKCICPSCRLFGSPFAAAKVRFQDCRLVDPDTWLGIEVRDGVGIDRDTRTAKRGIKYDFELVPFGTAFVVSVSLNDCEPYQLGMLLLGFDNITQGLTRLGGITSRGLGRVEVSWQSLREWTAAALLGGEQPSEFKDEALTSRLDGARDALRQRVLPSEG